MSDEVCMIDIWCMIWLCEHFLTLMFSLFILASPYLGNRLQLGYGYSAAQHA